MPRANLAYRVISGALASQAAAHVPIPPRKGLLRAKAVELLDGNARVCGSTQPFVNLHRIRPVRNESTATVRGKGEQFCSWCGNHLGPERGRLMARRRGYGRNVGRRNAGQTETDASSPDSVKIDAPSDA